MSRLRYEVLSREGDGPLPCLARAADGRVLRLVGEEEPGATWLGTWNGVPVYGHRAVEPADAVASGEPLEIDPPALDEVEVQMGPDRDSSGIFDPPGNTDGTVTGERTGSEGGGGGARPEQRRTAVLAWIAADADDHGAPLSGAPCEPLKRLLADEPPDPLPALDAGPAPDAPAPEAPAPDAPAPEAPAPREWTEPEDTATQIEGVPAMAPSAPPAAPPAPAAANEIGSPHPLLLIAVLVLAIAVWALLR